MHPRTLIRKAAVAQLLAANTAAAERVYETRVIPHRRTELPALAVYAVEESVEDDGETAPRELKRTLQLAIEGAVSGAQNVDDLMDAIAFEVEQALHADETLAGTAADSLLSSTELEVVADGDTLIGLLRLIYAVTYFAYPVASAELDDFNTANIRYDLEGEQAPADETIDVVTTGE
jgi:hypothetical protein